MVGASIVFDCFLSMQAAAVSLGGDNGLAGRLCLSSGSLAKATANGADSIVHRGVLPHHSDSNTPLFPPSSPL